MAVVLVKSLIHNVTSDRLYPRKIFGKTFWLCYVRRFKSQCYIVSARKRETTLHTHAAKGKRVPLQAWTGPWGSRRFRIPEFLDNQNMEVVMLSALCTCRLYPPGASLSEVTPWGGPRRRAPLLETPKDMLKKYITRYVKMSYKRVSLSIRAPLGNLEGIRLPGLFERKG
jgi:hypothetical protein